MEGVSFAQAMVAAQTPMHEIEKNLYLGSLMAANNEQLLKRTGIKYVVQALENSSIGYRHTGVSYHFIQIQDSQTENIARHLPEALRFIERYLSNGEKVLVHCAAGVSRSSSIVIAYIMAKYNYNYARALQHVRSKRHCVMPNDGFRRQLENLNPNTLKSYIRHN